MPKHEPPAADSPESPDPATCDNTTPQPPQFCANIYSDGPLPEEFVQQISALEAMIGMPVLLCIQNDPSIEYGNIDSGVVDGFMRIRHELPKGQQVALLIDSGGGQANAAFEVAKILRRHCGGFTAVIPQYAKSAATLLALGAKKILLGEYAQLGPLDAQILHRESEDDPGYRSALEEVQAIERLRAEAWQALDEAVILLLNRTRKTVNSILPFSIEFTAQMMRPLFEKVDVVQYTRMSRMLKIGEEYAIRLLRPLYSEHDAKSIADKLVRNYPTHGFIIDAHEAENIGLATQKPSEDMERLFDDMRPYLNDLTVVGRIMEVST